MRRLLLILPILLASCIQPTAASQGVEKTAASAPAPIPSPAPPTAGGARPSVHFSPKGGCTEAEAAFVLEARASIHLQAYGFTSPRIAEALCEAAKKPGVTVEVVLDRSNSTDKHSVMSQVQACGVHAWIDAKHQIAHNKVTIVDGTAVETGSFNYTQAAETGNAENCLVLHDADLAAQYEANFQVHKAHSVAQ